MPEAVEAPAPEGEAIDTIVVEDQDGNPVPGAYLLFSTDAACVPAQAEENEAVTFTGEATEYPLQVLKAPEDYRFDEVPDTRPEAQTSGLTIQILRED